MPSSLIRAKYVICRVDGKNRPVIVEDGAVFQRDGVIIEIGKGDDLVARHRPDAVLGSPGDVVLPGLVNAHHHIGLTPLQLGTPDLPLELWVVHRVGARAVDLYLDTLYSAFELVESGVTTVQHLHGRVPAPVERVVSAADEVIRAYDDIGMRVSYSFGVHDEKRLVHGEPDADLVRRLPPDLAPDVAAFLKAQKLTPKEGVEIFEILHRRYAGRERVRIQFAPGNLHWCSDSTLELVADAARRYGVTRHMHLAETAFQKEYSIRRTGTTVVRHLHKLGVLGPDLTLGHGVWLTEDEIDLIVETDTCICHNCSSNLRLRSGVAPLNVFRKRGIRVALGIDEAGLNDDRDMLQEMRLVLRMHRIPGMEDNVPTCPDVFRMASEEGAMTTPFGSRIGALERGRAADMIVLPWKSVAYPFLDPDVPVLDAVVQRAFRGTIDTVIVAGEVIMRGGRFTRLDKEAVLAELAERMRRAPTDQEKRMRAIAHRLVPYARAFYDSYLPDERLRDPYYKTSSKV